MNKFLSVALGLLLLALLASVTKCTEERDSNARLRGNVSALLEDKMTLTKDAEGRVTATKATLVLERADFLKVAAAKDEQIRNLQAAVKAAGKGTSGAVAFRAVTHTKAAGRVDSLSYRVASLGVSSADTLTKPTYYGTVRGFAFSAKVKAGPDSISLEGTQMNDFTVAMTTKGGLFKRPETVVMVKAMNPETGVEQVQSWQPPQPRPKRGLWAAAGSVLTLIAILAL